ncbi:unnamed protein product [Prorocentrum cordatum]|uniref:Sugar phosphate transporter domain-containing protein n=1 Tax=Prorocentrum cordatum TaxID=2364126 RepID=A0ABN9Q4N0_9DINO|nr:unnamed protein product [Polarella glacialis]
MANAVSEDAEKPVTVVDSAETSIGILSWMACSIGMLLCNKNAIHAFPVPCTLVGIQFLFTALVMVVVAGKSIHVGSRKDVLRWCRVIPFFSGMILSSILALKDAPMTLVITMRALSPITSLPIEMCFPNPIKLSGPMILSLVASLVGMGIYISTMDFNAGNLGGIGWTLANNLFAVVDRLLQRLMLANDQDPVDMSKTGVTLLNNILGVIPLVLAGLFAGEFSAVPEAVGNLDSVKLFWVISSCFVGAGISYTGVWVASLISATSFLVLINANKFFIIFLEVFVMKSKELSTMQIIGATISILAGIAYGKARDAVQAAEKEEVTDDTETGSGDTANTGESVPLKDDR